jgi:hypothetical protein
MKRRLLAAAGAATIAVTVLTPVSAQAAEPCPAESLCIYRNADFTGLISTDARNNVMRYGPDANDTISSVRNTSKFTHAVFFERENFGGWSVYVPPGESWVAPADRDNAISSLGVI